MSNVFSSVAPASLGVTVKMFLSHVHWKATGFGPDTLYVYIGMSDTDPAPDPADSVALMLSVSGTNVGFCFRRDGTVGTVTGLPTNTCSPSSLLTGRAVIGNFTSSQWAVELSLIPADFGLSSFFGTVGAVIRAVDASGHVVAVGPGVPVPQAGTPASWANLDFHDAVDVALVLDLSGSMQGSACGGGTCDPKIDVLKHAVTLFMKHYQTFAWQADRIAIEYFKSDVTSYPSAGLLFVLGNPCPTAAVKSCHDAVVDDVKLKMASGATAMGGGLQCAANLFATASPGRKPAIILFSDGMQNVNPMVHESGETPPSGPPFDGYSAGDFSIADEAGHPNAAACPEKPTATRLDGLGIKVHTIGVEATDEFVTLMENIASETGGANKNTTNPTADLLEDFLIALVGTLSTRSPQLVAFRRDTLAATSATQTFTINQGVRRIVLELIWQGETRLTFQVFKDGKDVTPVGQTTAETFYRMFTLDLPVDSAGGEITAGGQWELRIQGEPGTPYQAAAVVDEPALKYQVQSGNGHQVVGEPIELTAQVTISGAPVDDATITAVVGKPGEAIGTLLSVNPTPATTPTVPPESLATPGQVKLQRLLEDEALWRRIQPVGRIVKLQGVGNGKYVGVLGDADVNGSYQVRFLIEGESPEIGSYRRTQSVSTVVRFGQADFRLSEVEVRTAERTPAGRKAVLSLRPQNRYHDFVGPDFGHQIRVTLTNGSVVGEPRDLLDGRYEVTLLLPANEDPEITITVVGHLLFQGKVSQLERRPFALSLHAGVSIPHGTLNNTHNPGFGLTAVAEYWWRRRVAVAALFGYHRFNGEGANPDLDLIHASAALEARVTTGQPSVIVDAGAGIYDLSPGPTDPGVHGGAGLEFDVSPIVSLGFTGRVHTVFTTGSNTTFTSLQAGGRIRF